MADTKPNGIEPKSRPIEAAEPVEVPAIVGATFAERAAANQAGSKKVSDADAENKAVTSSESKSRRTKKKS